METNTNYEKAFVEGEDCGMAAGVCWNCCIETKPTDAELEIAAMRIFARRGLKFESDFAGRAAFIAGFWQGWREGVAPVPVRPFVPNPLQS